MVLTCICMIHFWQGSIWWDEETNGHVVDSSIGLGMISEQKGILGPGPAELRFPEALWYGCSNQDIGLAIFIGLMLLIFYLHPKKEEVRLVLHPFVFVRLGVLSDM